jgi:RNase P/RNase MRP subunit p29
MILLGKEIKIINSTNSSLNGLEGLVVADDRDSLTVRTKDGEKILIKHTLTIQCEGFIMEGSALLGTHAQRVKSKK